MKAALRFGSSFLLSLVLLFSVLSRVYAAGMSASFSGSSSVRAGERVTVTFSVSGASDLLSIRAVLDYDSSKLEYLDSSCLIGGDWTMDGTTTFLLEDPKQTSPFSGGRVFSVVFLVKDSVSSGSTVSASIGSISATDGTSDYYADSARWSASVSAPLSGNASLGSLSCGNATLSPAFSASTTSYACTVPFSVTSLDLRYTVSDSGASAWVSGNDLSVGANTVSIGVEAANGTVRYYNIYVTRQQDPNYKPSANARLSSLTPSVGWLSPVFDPDVAEYVIYLPFEVEEFSLSGVAQDGKALSVTSASVELTAGDNDVSVICTAEDGSTGIYTVHVFRMPAFSGILPEIIDPDTADYRAVDAALEKIPLDLSDYTEESVIALKGAVAGVVRNLKKEDQLKVDAMAKALEDALAGLEKRSAPLVLTPWQKILAAGEEGVALPLPGRMSGPVPLKYLLLAAIILPALLIFFIGALVGRRTGRNKAFRAIAPGDPGGDDGGPGGGDPPAPACPPPDEPPSEGVPVEDAPAEEAPAEEAPAEEAPAEEAPAEEAPAEEAPELFDLEDSLFPPLEKGIPPVESDPISRIDLDELLEDIRNM